jgi:hypothetical protein
MSALPPKADITQHGGNVRFVPKADIKANLVDQLVGAKQNGGWHINAEGLCDPLIDN